MLSVQNGLGVVVGVGVGVGEGLGTAAQYLPPVFKYMGPAASPPQTIIWLSAHTAVWPSRESGGLMGLVAAQLSVPGLYLPPVLRRTLPLASPPQTIISVPVHTAV